MNIIDVNVNLSRWPFRRVKWDETAELVAKLRSHGVTQAWAGSYDGLLHKDIAGVNARLVDECRRHGGGLLLPFGSVNLSLPAWEDDVRRCHEDFKMPGIRLHPNYHGYKLDDPVFRKLLTMAADRGLIVQLAALMEDERTLHPLVRVPRVDFAPLATALKETPKARVVVLNGIGSLRGEPLLRLTATGRVWFDIAALEGVAGVAGIIQQMPVDRLLFGSHAPFFYFDSALLKIKESALSDAHAKAICEENARALLSDAR